MVRTICFLLLLHIILYSCKSGKKLTKESASGPTEKSGIIARELNISEKEIPKNPLYRFLEKWYGTPYSYSSCSSGGVDCSCFARMLYENVYHITLPRTSREMFDQCRKIQKDKLREGDLVFFNTNGKGVSHVGVYLKNGKFTHASTKKGVMISHLEEEYFKKTFCGACARQQIKP